MRTRGYLTGRMQQSICTIYNKEGVQIDCFPVRYLKKLRALRKLYENEHVTFVFSKPQEN